VNQVVKSLVEDCLTIVTVKISNCKREAGWFYKYLCIRTCLSSRRKREIL